MSTDELVKLFPARTRRSVAQLRHIILLHQGKAEDHNGPMEVEKIVDKFRVDVAVVKRIVQFVSLPPEDTSKQKKNP